MRGAHAGTRHGAEGPDPTAIWCARRSADRRAGWAGSTTGQASKQHEVEQSDRDEHCHASQVAGQIPPRSHHARLKNETATGTSRIAMRLPAPKMSHDRTVRSGRKGPELACGLRATSATYGWPDRGRRGRRARQVRWPTSGNRQGEAPGRTTWRENGGAARRPWRCFRRRSRPRARRPTWRLLRQAEASGQGIGRTAVQGTVRTERRRIPAR